MRAGHLRRSPATTNASIKGVPMQDYRSSLRALPGLFPVLLLISTLFLPWPGASLAADPPLPKEEPELSARYSQPRGKSIAWHIQVPEAPPAALIIIQHIPPGTAVLEASPPYHSYDQEAGTIKWLLTDLQPGAFPMTMELDRPIKKQGEISGEINWLILDSGSFIW